MGIVGWCCGGVFFFLFFFWADVCGAWDAICRRNGASIVRVGRMGGRDEEGEGGKGGGRVGTGFFVVFETMCIHMRNRVVYIISSKFSKNLIHPRAQRKKKPSVFVSFSSSHFPPRVSSSRCARPPKTAPAPRGSSSDPLQPPTAPRSPNLTRIENKKVLNYSRWARHR